MTYQVSYEDGWAAVTDTACNGTTRTEHFSSEPEALYRARELVESGVHQAVSLSDNSGRVLAGIRLQLKLGGSVTD